MTFFITIIVYEYYAIILSLFWCTYGLGYIISIAFPPHIAQLAGVVIVFIINVFSGTTPTLPEFDKMTTPFNYAPYLSYLRFGKEVTYLIELERYRNIYNIDKSLSLLGYSVGNIKMDYIAVICYGIAFRVIACICLICYKPNSYYNKIGSIDIRYYLNELKNLICRKKEKTEERSSAGLLYESLPESNAAGKEEGSEEDEHDEEQDGYQRKATTVTLIDEQQQLSINTPETPKT